MLKEHSDVVIVGGSLSGLMQGIAIKRLGHNVTILEQHLSATREGQAAGIVTMEHSHAFMTRHDLLKEQPYTIDCSTVQILDKNLEVLHKFNRPMRMSSWNVLYYRFRANFDGLKSAYCPGPPSEPTASGRAVYDQGKRVTNVHEVGDTIELEYNDMISKTPGRIKADIVIVADGSNSYLRGLLQSHLHHTYAGYVAWRGTVPEEKVARQTRDLLENKTTLHTAPNGYIALYNIPGENGALQEGRRLFNFVWYTNLTSDSPQLQDAMTDSEGNTHRHTLPIGKMQSKVWANQRAAARSLLPAQICDLIDQTTQPFISSISDIDISRPSFYDGKLLFVGDALVQFRPHVACSTNQAAVDALLVEKLLKGEIDLSTWERQVLDYAYVTRLRSITWGDWYQVGYGAFCFSKARHLMAVVWQSARNLFR